MRTIDADVLKRKVQRLATEAWKMQVKASVETILNQFIDYIDHAPTVDAVPVKHGRWTDKDGGIATCSVCGDRWGVWSVMKYCPNCGARMDGKDGDGND